MKIMHLLQSNRFSGAENVVCQIIGLMKDEPDIKMIYCSQDGQIREALDERNVQFVPIKDLSISEVRRVIKEQKPDLIHAHDRTATFVAAITCGKTLMISHIHNNFFDSRGLSIKAVIYLVAARKAHNIFWVSQSAYNSYVFHRILAQKSFVLYNVIDAKSVREKVKSDSNSYNFDVIYIGRLTYQKDPQRLIKVFMKVIQKRPHVQIAIVGTGDLEQETRNLCQKLFLDKNITFLGFQSNPLKVLFDSKVMLMTSRWEGTPMGALEAMSLGVPIVSTPTDGMCDVVKDGVTGFLSDNDDDLVQKLLQIVDNNELRKSLSEASFIRFKELNDVDRYRETLLSVYKSAMRSST